MPKSLVLGNGNLLVCFDKNGYLRDLYYPHVGLENHLSHNSMNRIGVWVDGTFSWLHEEDWHIDVSSEKDTMIGTTIAKNDTLKISIHIGDVVYNEKNILVRKVTITNLLNVERHIKIFFSQEMTIYGDRIGDTGYYDPLYEVIIHYKGRRVFLINARSEGKRFDQYSIGIFGREGKEGTYKDAEDGILEKNPIEHGPVDSVIGFDLTIEASSHSIIDYWIVSAKSIHEAKQLNSYVLEKTPDHLLQTTRDFWHTWVNKENFNFHDLNDLIVGEFKKSLFIIRSHVDNNGSIIASCDSDMLQHGKDSYLYMWPRDAALVAIALDKAGDFSLTRKFYELANELITEEGYFLHKYRPDKSLGSSWHPWVRNDGVSLPIQEDETALVIIALWKHYQLTRDIEFIESVYNPLIKKAADFMLFYRDKKRGLVEPSYDLWEEKYGISTFTSATVFAALLAAAKFASLLGKKKSEEEYTTAAYDLKKATLQYLYNNDEKIFYKMINVQAGVVTEDRTVDMSSVYGVFKFGLLDINDPQLLDVIHVAEKRLQCTTAIRGIARYENDRYFRIEEETPGNPWIITTLWLTQYSIAQATNNEDLGKARWWLNWVAEKALPSGILPEQLNPHTGEQVQASPLTWSHAEFVVTVIEYLDKLESLGISKKNNPVR